ncbi:hypothetical protein J6590_070928 [Homalodisca vitripennis]|nr:hypothetical protein J6590_070928 [Homalodisca vitripennis]
MGLFYKNIWVGDCNCVVVARESCVQGWDKDKGLIVQPVLMYITEQSEWWGRLPTSKRMGTPHSAGLTTLVAKFPSVPRHQSASVSFEPWWSDRLVVRARCVCSI